MRLLPELHLIKPAFGQAYLWKEGSEIILIDTAIPGAEADFAAALAELGFRRGNLRRIIITHGH